MLLSAAPRDTPLNIAVPEEDVRPVLVLCGNKAPRDGGRKAAEAARKKPPAAAVSEEEEESTKKGSCRRMTPPPRLPADA